jgi:F0F1-type ATP synthase assembly protein I
MNKLDRKRKFISRAKGWQKEQAEAYRIYIKTSAVGLEVGLSIGIGAVLGYLLDQKFKTSPYCLLVGVVVGAIAAIKRLWQFTKNYTSKNGNSSDDNSK